MFNTSILFFAIDSTCCSVHFALGMQMDMISGHLVVTIYSFFMPFTCKNFWSWDGSQSATMVIGVVVVIIFEKCLRLC